MDRYSVFAELQRRAISRVEVAFSGGNDEGGCDDIRLYSGDSKEPFAHLEESHDYDEWDDAQQRWVSQTPSPDGELAQGLAKPVYDQYGTFCGDFTVCGVVIWDVAKRKVSMVKDEQNSWDHWEGDV